MHLCDAQLWTIFKQNSILTISLSSWLDRNQRPNGDPEVYQLSNTRPLFWHPMGWSNDVQILAMCCVGTATGKYIYQFTWVWWLQKILIAQNCKVGRALNIINNYASILKQFMKHEGYKWWSGPFICSGGSYVNLVKLGIPSVEPGGRRCRQRSPRQLINHNTLVNWHHSPGFLVPSSYPFCKI